MQYVPPLGATDPNASYIEGNPAAGIRGSYPTATGYEAIMREICNAITAAGLSPNPNDLAQLTQAIIALSAVPSAALWHKGTDTSTNAAEIVCTATPSVSGHQGETAYLIVPAHNCVGATMLDVGFGASNLTRSDTTALQIGDYNNGQPLIIIDDGTQFRLMNPLAAVPAPGEGLTEASSIFALNYPGLTEEDTLGSTDLISFYQTAAEGGQSSGHHRKTTFSSFAAAILALASGGGGGGSGLAGARGLSGYAPGGTKTAAWTIKQTLTAGGNIAGTNLSLSFNGAATGAGGMDAGSVPTSADLSVYAIYNPTSSTWNTLGYVGAPSGTDIYQGSHMPSGYTASQLIWSGKTDGSGNIVTFGQVDRRVYTIESYAIFGATATSWTALGISSLVPANAVTYAGFSDVGSQDGAANQGMLLGYNISGAIIIHRNDQSAGVPGTLVWFENMPITTVQTIFYMDLNGSETDAQIVINGYTF